MTPIERAREAAAKAAAEVIQDAFDRKARPVTDVSNAALDAYTASLAEDGMVLVPRVATDAMVKGGMAAKFGSVMVGGIQHAEVKLGPPGCQRVWSAMIEAATSPPPPEAQG